MTISAVPTDPVTELENATWALVAVITTQRDAARSSLARTLLVEPQTDEGAVRPPCSTGAT